MILLIHAYSKNNRGDGLLVDASIGLVRDAFPDESDIVVAALDPSSFPGQRMIAMAGGNLPKGRKLFHASATSVRLALRLSSGGAINLGEFSEAAKRARLIVGVGGGYMRSSGCIYGIKAALAHAAQSFAATDSGRPVVYLSQSIGPFTPPFGWITRRAAAQVPLIFVRDDRSLDAIPSRATLERVPDLAIMELFERSDISTFAETFPKTYLIARSLDRSAAVVAGYRDRLNALRGALPGIEPVLQSTGRGNDDLAFYRDMGWGDTFRSAAEVIRTEPGVVVSVRLHGALQSIIDGCPSVHLSYERKGWGAFEDLGISSYVHNAQTFDVPLVTSQAKALMADAAGYWSTIRQAAPAVRTARQHVINALRTAVTNEPIG